MTPDTDAIQNIQRQILVLSENRAKVELNIKAQVNSKLAALDQALEQRQEDLREAAGKELDAGVRNTDLREDFDQKMKLLGQERANRERELIRLANAELDDLDRQTLKMELELEQRVFEKDTASIPRQDDRPAVAVQATAVQAVAVQSKDNEPKVDKPSAPVASDTDTPESGPGGAEQKTGKAGSRGFFFNSVSGNLGGIDGSLDPITIAVLGILITLLATTIQLVKGN